MKKIFIITLLLGLLLATVGCSNKETASTANTTNTTLTESPNISAAADAQNQASATQAPTASSNADNTQTQTSATQTSTDGSNASQGAGSTADCPHGYNLRFDSFDEFLEAWPYLSTLPYDEIRSVYIENIEDMLKAVPYLESLYRQNQTSATQATTVGSNDLAGTSSPIIEIEAPPDSTVYHFDSYADLAKALTDSSSDEFKLLRSEQARYGTLHTNTLSLFASGDFVPLVPEMNGEPIPYRNVEGYNPYSYLTSELYGLPWTWYFCTLNGSEFRVQIANPGVLNREEISSATTYLDVLNLIAPDAPSPSNYQEYANYETIYEEEITLADGQVVTAMFSELKDSTKIYVMLYIDDVLVCMYGEAQLFSDAFWASFDLAPQGT